MKNELRLFVPNTPALPVPAMVAISIAGSIVPFMAIYSAYDHAKGAGFIGLAVGVVGFVICTVIALKLAGVRISNDSARNTGGSVVTIKLNWRYMFALIAFLILIAPKLIALAAAEVTAVKALNSYDNISAKSESHNKYMTEFIDCWWKPFGKPQICVEEMQKKYVSSSQKEIVDSVLREADLIK